MAQTILDNFDNFNFMVVLLFLYVILMGFILMIIINVKTRAKYYNQQVGIQNQQANQQANQQFNQYPQTTQLQCIPKITDGKC